MMRVIGGAYKGRQLRAPKRAITRPTASRPKEGMFNVLGSMGGIEGFSVVDCFAGSGSLGIEALSRGAGFVTFVDKDIDAIKTIESNLAPMGADNYRLVRREVESFVSTMEPVDLVFVDPPFAIDDANWQSILANIKAQIVVAESNRDISTLFPERYGERKLRVYGDSVVVVASAEVPEELK